MTSNKARNYAFRLEVIMALRAAGYTSAFRPEEPKNVAPGMHGDVLGVPGCTIAVRNQRDLALAEAMNEVEREATAEGNDLYVSVQHRRAHPVEQAYATMPLHVFIRLLTHVLPPCAAASA
jgi:hypothetical protein